MEWALFVPIHKWDYSPSLFQVDFRLEGRDATTGRSHKLTLAAWSQGGHFALKQTEEARYVDAEEIEVKARSAARACR
jgi:hypothetical protein